MRAVAILSLEEINIEPIGAPRPLEKQTLIVSK
jgi:hypothetical protein